MNQRLPTFPMGSFLVVRLFACREPFFLSSRKNLRALFRTNRNCPSLFTVSSLSGTPLLLGSLALFFGYRTRTRLRLADDKNFAAALRVPGGGGSWHSATASLVGVSSTHVNRTLRSDSPCY